MANTYLFRFLPSYDRGPHNYTVVPDTRNLSKREIGKIYRNNLNRSMFINAVKILPGQRYIVYKGVNNYVVRNFDDPRDHNTGVPKSHSVYMKSTTPTVLKTLKTTTNTPSVKNKKLEKRISLLKPEVIPIPTQLEVPITPNLTGVDVVSNSVLAREGVEHSHLPTGTTPLSSEEIQEMLERVKNNDFTW